MACTVGLADLGWKVVSYEIQPDRIEQLKRGITPYREQGIELTIAVWGLAFKAGTDDIRDSIALIILSELSRRGVKTSVYDPGVHVARFPADGRLATYALEAIDGADALLVFTEWAKIASIEPPIVKRRLHNAIVIDERNVLHAGQYWEEGFLYKGIGRPMPKILLEAAIATAIV